MTEHEFRKLVLIYANAREWAKLLEAIHVWTEQKRAEDIASLGRYYGLVGQLSERITGLNMQAEAFEKRLPLLEAKADVCDAYVEAHALVDDSSICPSDQRHEFAENRIVDALTALRELQEKPNV